MTSYAELTTSAENLLADMTALDTAAGALALKAYEICKAKAEAARLLSMARAAPGAGPAHLRHMQDVVHLVACYTEIFVQKNSLDASTLSGYHHRVRSIIEALLRETAK